MYFVPVPRTITYFFRNMSVGYFCGTILSASVATTIVKENTLAVLLIELKPNIVKTTPKVTDGIGDAIGTLYKDCWRINRHVDVRVNVEAMKYLKSLGIRKHVDLVFVDDRTSIDATGATVIKVSHHTEPEKFHTGNTVKMFNNVVLGGTFDRLHCGHKILLTEAVLRCQKKLTVGVTDNSMIKGKKLWELIEPVETRINKVKDFLMDVDGNLVYNVVPISDMYGPTKSDPDLDLLVVSSETMKGGQKVNDTRIDQKLNPLSVHCIRLVEDDNIGEADEEKISSSNQRLQLLGTLLRPVEAKPHLPSWPYIIGLTGGIASGKSTIAEYITAKGAGHVNCDIIAHKIYRKGTSMYDVLVEHFGKSIVRDDGEIDRKALGAIVFNDKNSLDYLNQLLWPAILKASLEEAQRLYIEEGKKVVVMEAAIMIQAGWKDNVHEVWVTIIPPEEAIKRVVERNHLSQEAAKSRVDAQTPNSQQVAQANVVFCSLYSHKFTKSQVERAWRHIAKKLEKKKQKK